MWREKSERKLLCADVNGHDVCDKGEKKERREGVERNPGDSCVRGKAYKTERPAFWFLMDVCLWFEAKREEGKEKI